MKISSADFYLDSSDKSNKIHAVIWQGEKKPRAVLQIIHGMCEYIRRYEDFAAFMAEHGFVVCGHDHLGHGETAADAGDRGFFAEKEGWKLLVEDSWKVTAELKDRYPDLPIFVLGHSMGSFIFKNYLSKYGSKINGALISGTGGPNPLGGVGIALTKLIAVFKGNRHRSKFIDNMAFGSYCKKIEGCKTEKDWLTRDDDIVNAYRADDNCMFLFTLAGYRDLFTLLKNATDKNWENTIPRELPVLYFAGSDDPVGSYGSGVQTVYDRLAKAGQKDVSLKLYSGMRHETLNEIGKEQVYADILEWIENRL